MTPFNRALRKMLDWFGLFLLFGFGYVLGYATNATCERQHSEEDMDCRLKITQALGQCHHVPVTHCPDCAKYVGRETK